MTAVYEIAIDRNGDGFVAWDVQQGDALNLVPDAVRMEALPLYVDNGIVALQWAETDYGIRLVDAFLDTGAAEVALGRSLSQVNVIPVTGGQTYTAAVWLRADGDYSGIGTRFRIVNQGLTERAVDDVNVTQNWTRASMPFTAQPGDTHVALVVDKPVGSPTMPLEIAGPTLVDGTTHPTAFNSGDPLDYENHISADVLSLRWHLGMAQTYDAVAAPTTGQIVVRNEDGRYSPEQGQIRLEPHTRVKVRVIHESETVHLFSGWIMQVTPDTGSLGARRAALHLAGPEHDLAQTHVLTDLLVNAAPDDLLGVILSREPLDRIDTALRPSASLFAYAGDTWGDGIIAARAIRQIVEAERGRFYSDRRGMLHFLDRDYLPGLAPTLTAFDDAYEAVDYIYGADIVNEVRVRVKPRAIGSPGTVIWRLTNAQPIQPGAECRVIVARFRDDNGNPIGATGLVTPVANTDYTANTKADGSGDDATAQLSVSFGTGGSASAVNLIICNNGAQNVYLQPGTQIRGTPLIQGDTLLVQRRDEASVDTHGLHTLLVDLPYFVTAEAAEVLADYLLLQRKRPFGLARTITLNNCVRFHDALRRSLFDQIAVRETHTGHDADYLIISETHTVDLGGTRHVVEWLLEPVNPGGLWQLNRSALNTTTRLGLRF